MSENFASQAIDAEFSEIREPQFYLKYQRQRLEKNFKSFDRNFHFSLFLLSTSTNFHKRYKYVPIINKSFFQTLRQFNWQRKYPEVSQTKRVRDVPLVRVQLFHLNESQVGSQKFIINNKKNQFLSGYFLEEFGKRL